MHLKSLTVKGFKSFAQPTTFVFEPGITCIVGPNGSGKSNVVDALAWVMGEQGARTLRGGKMDDVIFAGTATRGPLGRAEVVLTIDNGDGALSIPYTEVTISRILFRSGASEYAINGETARLLDVQELLSDSGLGREMHVIVGQGQLDAVLRATPEERRGYIEEAAGILKHRRRRERTERKLESMQANLTRLTDLAIEVRRQLKPLGAQAEVAREAQTIQIAVRESRGRLAAAELRAVDALIDDDERAAEAADAERDVLEDRVALLGRRVAELDAAVTAPELEALRRAVVGLEGAQVRVRGLHGLAQARLALFADDADEQPAAVGPDPDERGAIEAAIAAAERELADAQQAVADGERLAAAVRAELAARDRAAGEYARAVRARDARRADLAGRLRSAEVRLTAAVQDAERRAAQVEEATARRDSAARVAEQESGLVADGPDPAELEPAEAALDATRAQQAAAVAAVSALERELASHTAKIAALDLVAPAAARVAGATPMSEAITVAGGWEAAVAAALGELAEAGVVADRRSAVGALEGAVGAPVALVVGDAEAEPIAAVEGLTRAVDVVRGPAGVLAALGAVLLADDLETANRLWPRVGSRPDARVVTRGGQSVGLAAVQAVGGRRSVIELAAERDAAIAARERAAAALDEARHPAQEITERVRAASTELDELRRALRATESQRRQLEREAASRLARADSATAELDRVRQQAADAATALERARTARDAAALAANADDETALPPDPAPARPVQQRLGVAEAAVVSARLTGQTLHERVRSERARLARFDANEAAAIAAAEVAARRMAARRAGLAVAQEVLAGVEPLQISVDRSLVEARVRLAEVERRVAEQYGALREARAEESEARARMTVQGEALHDAQMRLVQHRGNRAAILERVAVELGLDADGLLTEYAHIDGFDRPAEEKRLRAAERSLAQLGRVNPLALEEFAAVEQRHAFLTEQLADLQRTRTDLHALIVELDGKMRTIFEQAYADVADAFERIFPMLFPGGDGGLLLTDPDDMDRTGVEIRAKPAGKRIERLSLLSGGERSLTALAFLVAIFTARPSPFTILDEVEAALDDANLGRLLQVVESLRGASQLILITHQKRTMEIADALYGVSMQKDGVSAVISQRMARVTA